MDELYLIHSGVAHDENPPGRGSGRFAYGSGEHPNQREPFSTPMIDAMRKDGSSDKDIADLMKKAGFSDVDIYRKLHKAGWKDTEIADSLDMKTTQLRAKISIAKYEETANNTAAALHMHDEGLSNMEIARRLGVTEGTIRNYLNPTIGKRNDVLKNTADTLKDLVEEKKYIDIGPGADLALGVTSTKLGVAVAMLEEEGYKKFYVYEEQLGTGKKTTITVLAPPGTTYPELMQNRGQIQSVENYIQEGNEVKTRLGIEPPTSVDSSRISVRYAEDGGVAKDGTIEIRRGVEDLSLGSSSYAQVRIGVDGTHYLKGMAVYGDDKDFPPGVDIIVNSNKHEGTPWMSDDPDAKQVFKPMKDDPDNPFGASIKIKDGQVVGQRHVYDANGNDLGLSPVNIIREEGDWSEWSKTLASQMLSKQPLSTASKQLKLSYDARKEEYEDIISLTNPTVRKKLLQSFAEGCDAAAVNLKAAALPGQQNYVILPVPEMKDTEIYAPKYPNGTQVVCIRYPHAGTFEIPSLTVNNKQKDAKAFMNNAKDAVGINPRVAEQLSGADFDGDTVLVIPTVRPDGTRISNVKSSKAIKELVDFDPKESYPGYEGMKKMTDHTKQVQMGMVSNLITDMTIGGATEDELVRAVKHSMVVIDAQKHKLNYKQSEKDNRIDELRKKYQLKEDGSYGGASTIISRASAEARTPVRKKGWKPDAETGEWVYTDTPEYYPVKRTLKDGTVVEETRERKMKTTQMALAKDARDLMSGPNHEGQPIERVYAKYANDLKSLANEARKEAVNTPLLKTDPAAKKLYSKEVASLEEKLRVAKSNAPRERQAQLLANEIMRAKQKEDPNMDNDHIKKQKSLALANARDLVGAKKQKIKITDQEWKAIQAGAISDNKLLSILNNADDKDIKQLAMPRTSNELSSSKQSLIKSMNSSGYSIAEIAERLDISSSTVAKYM